MSASLRYILRWCKCEQQKKKIKFIFSTVFFQKQQKKNI